MSKTRRKGKANENEEGNRTARQGRKTKHNRQTATAAVATQQMTPSTQHRGQQPFGTGAEKNVPRSPFYERKSLTGVTERTLAMY